MSCAGCSVTIKGTPPGCRDKGHCKTGGCNKLNTYNWLNQLPIAFGTDDYKVFEVSFRNGTRKGFYKNEKGLLLGTGDDVVVETQMGYDVGKISLSGPLVKVQMKKKKVKESITELKNVERLATEEDIALLEEARSREQETMIRSRAIAKSLRLEMKIGDVEFQADNKKVTFYYTAEGRVDFRELIKAYAREFKAKVEMRQIGLRQEAARIGGIGSCGRELCCSTWLTDFKSVTTATVTRYQNLAVNMAKLSGQCGRLKCCLNYELDTYLEAWDEFPKKAEQLETFTGTAYLQKTDILKRMMFYTFPGNPIFYGLTIEQVMLVQDMNKKGQRPHSLEEFAEAAQPKEAVKSEYEDTVGAVSLEALEKNDRNRRNNNRQQNRPPHQRNQPPKSKTSSAQPEGENRVGGEKPQRKQGDNFRNRGRRRPGGNDKNQNPKT